MYFCIKYLRYDNGVLFNLKVVGCFGKGGGGIVILDFGMVLIIYFV